MSKKNNTNETKYVCCQCNENFNSLTYFYKTYSNLYSGTGHLPICKDCSSRLFEKYVEQYGSVKKAMQRFCMAFDLYFNNSIYDSCDSEKDSLLGNYIRRLNMIQCHGKTFDTTLAEGFKFEGESKEFKLSKQQVKSVNSEPEPEIDSKDIETWGDGLDYVDYEILNNHYKLLKDANPHCDSNQEIFINNLCYIKMQQMKAVREKKLDDFNKMTESYIKSFKQAGLKTVSETNTDEDFTIGVNVETIEKYTPAEYYKNKSLFKDFDSVGNYFERFVLRPLRNLQHGTNDRDYEFYVKDEEEVDIYDDE